MGTGTDTTLNTEDKGVGVTRDDTVKVSSHGVELILSLTAVVSSIGQTGEGIQVFYKDILTQHRYK